MEVDCSDGSDVNFAGKPWPQQSVPAFLRAELPECVRVAEVHLTIGREPQAHLRGHLPRLTPRERASQPVRDLVG